MTILEKIWTHADEKFAELMQDRDNANLKGYLRGLSYTLATFMPPHFREPNEIARELAKRHKMHQAGEPYDTPGLGSLRYATPPAQERPRNVRAGTDTPAPQRPAKRAHTASPEKELDEKAINQIVLFGTDGGFSPEDLAKVHGVSVAKIKQILLDAKQRGR